MVSIEDYPQWLLYMATRVDELVCDPEVMEHFRKMVRKWAAEHVARGHKRPKRNPVRFLPACAMTLAEKYARLAAIHYAAGDEFRIRRVDPWRGSKKNVNRLKSSIPYAVLYDQIKGLTESSRIRVEGFLTDVQADIATLVRGTRRQNDAATSKQLAHQPEGDGANKIDGPTATTKPLKPTTRREKQLECLAKAMLLVRDHPDWSDRRIAKQIGVHPSTLSRGKVYQAAAALARGDKGRRPRGFIKRDPVAKLTDVVAFADGDTSDS